MAWISGRTYSPESGELVFTIDENAQLPGPQYWQQIWIVCEGPEPIITAQDQDNSPQYADELTKASRYGIATASEYIGEHLEITADSSRSFGEVKLEDVEMFRCHPPIYRTVTVSIVNFDINDDGDSVMRTEGCIGKDQCDTIGIYLRTRGKNPSRDTLNRTFPNDVLRAICWHESRWIHFGPNGKPIR